MKQYLIVLPNKNYNNLLIQILLNILQPFYEFLLNNTNILKNSFFLRSKMDLRHKIYKLYIWKL